MDVSVIIPVFNCEKYLDRCLESVIASAETYGGKTEILAIDNASSDKSPEILLHYATKYPQIVHFLQCATPGAAAVRNFGVKKARGKYIWFVDADDEIAPGAIKQLVEAADAAKADLTTLGLAKVYPDGHRDYLHAIRADDPEFVSKFIRNELGPVQVLIRRAWYTHQGFSFLEGIIHEDMEMMPALILKTSRFASVDEPLYIYYQNTGSVLHPTEWDPHYFDIFPALENLYRRFEDAGAATSYHDELEWFFIWNLLMDSAEYFRKFPEGREGLSRSRKMLRKYFPRWYKNRFFQKVSLKTKVKIIRNYL